VAGRTPETLSDPEIRAIALLLSPDYIVPAAQAHGGGSPVLGAEAAYREALGVLRSILTAAYFRQKTRFKEDPSFRRAFRRDVRLSLQTLGMRGRFQAVDAIEQTPWRKLSEACWPRGCPIDGWVEVRVPDDPPRVERAVLRALCRLLASEPGLNRALLDGRVWRRRTPEVMLHVELRPDEVYPVTLDASELDDEATATAIRGKIKDLIRQRRHRLSSVADGLLLAWVRCGFVASPAGAMLSAVGSKGIECGLPALVPANGVPLAVAIGEVRGGRATLGITMDHRAFDASHGGNVHRYLREEVEALCERRS